MSLFRSEKAEKFEITREDVEKVVATPMSDLDILVSINTVVTQSYMKPESKYSYLLVIHGLVCASEKLLSLMDDDTKKEYEGFIKTLITNKEKLLRYYGNHPS